MVTTWLKGNASSDSTPLEGSRCGARGGPPSCRPAAAEAASSSQARGAAGVRAVSLICRQSLGPVLLSTPSPPISASWSVSGKSLTSPSAFLAAACCSTPCLMPAGRWRLGCAPRSTWWRTSCSSGERSTSSGGRGSMGGAASGRSVPCPGAGRWRPGWASRSTWWRVSCSSGERQTSSGGRGGSEYLAPCTQEGVAPSLDQASTPPVF